MKTRLIAIFIFLAFINALSFGQDFWEEIIIPDSISNIFDFESNSQNQLYICTEEGIFCTDNNGQSWNNIAGFKSSAIEISNLNEIYLGLDSENRILYSNSNGQSWDTIQTNFSLGGKIKLIHDSLLFAFDWGWLSKSEDGGYNWINVLSVSTLELFNDIIGKDNLLFSGSVNFIHSNGGGVYKSFDFGNNWDYVSLSGHGVSSFAIDINNMLLCGVDYHYNNIEFGIFRSIDNGISWTMILGYHYVTCLEVDIYGGIYAGCNSDFGLGGVQFSSDNGISWIELNSGLHENSSVSHIEVASNGYIFLSTIQPTRLFRSVNPLIGIKAFKRRIPIEVFPNPFKDFVIIKHNLKHQINNGIDVKIYNCFGQIVYDNTINGKDGSEYIIPLTFIDPGIYLMLVINSKFTWSETIIKY